MDLVRALALPRIAPALVALALIDAAGRAWTAGELLAGANRLVHALRPRVARSVLRGKRSAAL